MPDLIRRATSVGDPADEVHVKIDGTSRRFVKILDPPDTLTIEEQQSHVYIHIGYLARLRVVATGGNLGTYTSDDFRTTSAKVWLVRSRQESTLFYETGREPGCLTHCALSCFIAVFSHGYIDHISLLQTRAGRHSFRKAIALTLQEWEEGKEPSFSLCPALHQSAVRAFNIPGKTRKSVGKKKLKEQTSGTVGSKKNASKIRQKKRNRSDDLNSGQHAGKIPKRLPASSLDKATIVSIDNAGELDSTAEAQGTASITTGKEMPTSIIRNGIEIPIMAGGYLQRMFFSK